MSVEQTIHRLLDPEDGLRCLPAFWSEFCLQFAQSRSPRDQQCYLDEHLRVLLRYVEPLADELAGPNPFAPLCDTLRTARSFEEIAQQLHLPPPLQLDTFAWMPWVVQTQMHPILCLYAAAAQLAFPVVNEETPDRLRGAPLLFIANAFPMLGLCDWSIELGESYLGLSSDDYVSPTRMRAALDRSSRLAELEANNRATFLIVLAEALRAVQGRGRAQAACLLEAYPGEPMHCFADAIALTDVHPVNRISLVDAWLRNVDSVETAVETCRAVVNFVRNLREDELPGYAQRAEFLGQARKVWDTIQRVSLQHVEHEGRFGEEGRRRADGLLRELHYWAEQFHNRVLVERLFLSPEPSPPEWMVDDFRRGLTMLQQPWGPPTVGDARRKPAERPTGPCRGGLLGRLLGHGKNPPEAQPIESIEDLADRESRRRQALNEAPQTYLEVVQRHFDLDPLRRVFTASQWRDTDVLFQIPGPLLAAPLAWLDFGKDGDGKPQRMFEAVASTGSVVSLTLRRVAETEAEEAGLPVQRLLSAHWEQPEHRNPFGGFYALQQGMIDAGKSHGWEIWCLGDEPRATADNLRAAINDRKRRFGVVVVNAHGIQGRAGVRLAGEGKDDASEWRGDGADLRDTDLVMLAACSVGRLQEQGGRDVEGMYAELAAHHGRTMIAARWPIADTETALLTAELIREYQQTVNAHRAAGDRRVPSFARARALNRARRRLLASGKITDHVAAAFEIYGLG